MNRIVKALLSGLLLCAGCTTGGFLSGTGDFSGGDFVIVNAAPGLNLRQLPKIDAPIVIMIPQGDYAEVVPGEETPDVVNGRKGSWLQIRYRDKTGYAFDAFLERAMRVVQDLPELFDYEGRTFHEGADCSGVTYSEYSGTLEFRNGTVTMTRKGASSTPCTLKPGQVDTGYTGFF